LNEDNEGKHQQHKADKYYNTPKQIQTGKNITDDAHDLNT
jgi:hypothetical protein